MKPRYRYLGNAIMLVVTSIVIPIVLIVVSINHSENLPIAQAIIYSVIAFVVCNGGALFSYSIYKRDKEDEEYKEARIRKLEKTIREKDQEINQKQD